MTDPTWTPVDVPPDLRADVERTSVRVVVQDGRGSVLLFRTIDPTDPAVGTWWELPGGGMEPDETVAATAARELAEETGFVVPERAFGPAHWVRAATYLRRGRRVLQHELVVRLQLAALAPEPARDRRTAEELEDYTGHRWWTVAAVEAAAGTARFYPGRLPELLPAFLAGADVREDFEWWN